MKNPKIAFLDAGTLFEIDNLKMLDKLGEVTYYHQTLPSQTIERLQNIDIAITNKVMIDKPVLDACKNLKLICVAATGTNNIAIEEAYKRGIMVKNAVGYSTNSVAQITWGMILNLVNHHTYYQGYVENKTYAQSEFFTHVAMPFFELKGKRLGIIGLGNIGKRVAEIGKAFGMEIVYHSVSGNEYQIEYQALSLSDLLKTADVVTVHVPLGEKSFHLLHYKNLALMKKSAILIGVSRGNVINEADLVQIINEEKIAGAGLDVFSQEPLPSENIIYQIKDKTKIILAPHIAWASVEARRELVNKIYKNISDFLKEG